MYAVIETGGKQYRVQLGTEIAVDRLEVEPGSTVEIDRVLLVADGEDPSIGRPLVEGARVSAHVVRQDRGDKIVVFKYRPKARHRTKQGHRQDLTILRIADIRLGDRSAAAVAQQQDAQLRDEQAAAAEEAARRAAADQALAERLAREADSEAPTDQGATRTRTTRRRVSRAAAPAASAAAPAAEAPAATPATDADADVATAPADQTTEDE